MTPKSWRTTLLITAVAALIAACEVDTDPEVEASDWWRCPERLDGDWTFGRAPYGCDVEAFGSAETVRTGFSAYIFDDARPREEERIRYMEQFGGFLGKAAGAYIRSRRPDVTEAEVSAWRHAVYATAHQESFWSHYREGRIRGGPILTMLRGDQGHGHGLMQIDDRYHTDAIASGVGWRLDENLTYGLDIYFEGWRRAPDQWCVVSATDWEARARAAYSAYNGGPAQICRWTDPDDPWARNDQGFYDKYTRQQWTLWNL